MNDSHEDPNHIRSTDRSTTKLDRIDRKLLGLLRHDAAQTYAQLAKAVHLSTASVHERVRKLRRNGAIRRTTVDLDPATLGRPLLAFVHVDTSGWGKGQELMKFAEDSRVEEMHSVTGRTCLIVKIRCRNGAELEDLIEQLYRIPNVRSTESFVAMRSPVDRGTCP